MRLQDLVAEPGLALRVLHAGAGALERTVRWTCTTDLRDPSRYLSGGELVLTGLVWRSGPQDSDRFVAAVARAGAVAIAAGDARFGTVPADLLEACRRHDVALLEVPEEVDFGSVTERVLAALAAERGDRLAADVGRHRRLLAAFAEGRGLGGVAALVSADTGLTCRVLTASGRQVAAAGSPLPADVVDVVTATFHAADRLPARTGGEPSYSVFAVGPTLGPRAGGWFLAVEGDWTRWQPGATDAVAEVAVISALERARQDEALRAARHLADEAVTRIAAGEGAAALPLLRQAGWSTGQATTVAVAHVPGGGAEAAAGLLADVVAHLGPALVGAGPVDGDDVDRAVALIACGDRDAGDRVRRALSRLAPGLGRGRVAVGVSRPADTSALAGAYDEARHALRLAEVAPGPVGVVTGTDVTSHVGLLATVPDDVRRGFAQGVLGPVLAYDAQHGAGLHDTLATWLDQGGSWSRTAEALHLHVNTVRYRVGRVEQLTGRDLSRLEDRVDVFLALRSL